MLDWVLLTLAIALAAIVTTEITKQRKWRKVMAQSERIEGLVQNTNDRGLKLVGETKWRNYTTHNNLPRAEVGDRVELAVSGDWINAIAIHEHTNPDTGEVTNRGSSTADLARNVGESLAAQRQALTTKDREHTNFRMAALKQATHLAAANIAVGKTLTGADVLKLADVYLSWLNGEHDE